MTDIRGNQDFFTQKIVCSKLGFKDFQQTNTQEFKKQDDIYKTNIEKTFQQRDYSTNVSDIYKKARQRLDKLQSNNNLEKISKFKPSTLKTNLNTPNDTQNLPTQNSYSKHFSNFIKKDEFPQKTQNNNKKVIQDFEKYMSTHTNNDTSHQQKIPLGNNNFGQLVTRNRSSNFDIFNKKKFEIYNKKKSHDGKILIMNDKLALLDDVFHRKLSTKSNQLEKTDLLTNPLKKLTRMKSGYLCADQKHKNNLQPMESLPKKLSFKDFMLKNKTINSNNNSRRDSGFFLQNIPICTNKTYQCLSKKVLALPNKTSQKSLNSPNDQLINSNKTLTSSNKNLGSNVHMGIPGLPKHKRMNSDINSLIKIDQERKLSAKSKQATESFHKLKQQIMHRLKKCQKDKSRINSSEHLLFETLQNSSKQSQGNYDSETSIKKHNKFNEILKTKLSRSKFKFLPKNLNYNEKGLYSCDKLSLKDDIKSIESNLNDSLAKNMKSIRSNSNFLNLHELNSNDTKSNLLQEKVVFDRVNVFMDGKNNSFGKRSTFQKNTEYFDRRKKNFGVDMENADCSYEKTFIKKISEQRSEQEMKSQNASKLSLMSSKIFAQKRSDVAFERLFRINNQP